MAMADGLAGPDPVVLGRLGEWFAAGYFENPASSPMRRWSRAVRRELEHRPPALLSDRLLYPWGIKRGDDDDGKILVPDYSFTWDYRDSRVEERLSAASDKERETLLALRNALAPSHRRMHQWATPHVVGGAGYTHCVPNYERVVREGLNGYARRVAKGLEEAEQRGDAERIDFYRGMQDVFEGIRAWHARLLERLEESTAAIHGQTRAVLERVPFEPASNFVEAVLSYNFVFYLDGCDNPGRLDHVLFPYYEHDLKHGRTSRNEALRLLREFTDNVCVNGGWSAAIGGTGPDGSPAYNELTILCMQAVHGKHRPNYELRVRPDMPEQLWDAALDALATGCGQPALYNEDAYLDALREPGLGVREADLHLWNGGGCTETMIQGCSNVGSLDAGVNLPLVLVESLRNRLESAGTFAEFLAGYKSDLSEMIAEVTGIVSEHQERRGRFGPQPVRSLLVDDCIDAGVEFNAGGARYNWSVINIAGLANVSDSLAALKEVVFDKAEIAPREFLAILERDFAGEEAFRQRLTRCPRFGNDEPEVDKLAADVAKHVFREFRHRRPWRGGIFLPSCIMFETYGPAGQAVGATPDGRRAGDPLADSIGPYQGRDTNGPTAMLRSVARLPLHLAAGTPIVNVRFAAALFGEPESRHRVVDLIRTFFKMGGMQVQVSVADQAVLRDAMVHPERHGDLIVRIGGYSTYFNWLTAELKEAVLLRTEHGV